MSESISIRNMTKAALPRAPFANMTRAAFGKNYDLSLVFVGTARMRRLNRTYRNIDKATDILSFPLDEKAGEIFICQEVARRKMKLFDVKPSAGRSAYENFIAFLFIHGLMHLKGMEHGSTMEKAEMKLRKLFRV